MVIISTLIGLVTGVTLTILSEVVKRTSQKKVAVAKLHSEAIIQLKNIIESDMFEFEGAARKIYNKGSFSDIENSEKRLSELLEKAKAEMLKDKNELEKRFNSLKSDTHNLDKHLYHIGFYEEKYRNETLILSKNEISYLSPSIQPLVIEFIENSFHLLISYKYFLLRLKNDEVNIEQSTNDFIEYTRYVIKTHKDRKTIFDYSLRVSKRSFLGNLFG